MADKKYDFSDFDEQPKTEGYDFSDFKTTEEPTKTATAVGSGLQGLLMGFSDEAEGGIGTALRAAGVELDDQGNFKQMTSPTLDTDVLSKTYEKVRDDARRKLETQKEANPNTALISELVGGVATPAFGAASIAKGAAQATKLGSVVPTLAKGAAIGATGAAVSGMGQADQLSDITAQSVGSDVLVGGGLGAAFGGVGATIGKLADAVKGTKFAKDMSKVFTKSKAGEDLLSEGVEEALNKDILSKSKNITEKVSDDFDKFKQTYGKEVEKLFVGKPDAVIKDLQAFADNIAEQQVRTGYVDPREINKQINNLRKNVDLNNEEISGLSDLMTRKGLQARALISQNQFGNVAAGKTVAKSQKEIQDEVVKMRSDKLDLQQQLKEIKRVPKEERDLLEQRILEDKIDELNRNIFDTSDELRNTKFSDKLSKVDTTTTQKASQGIASDASDTVSRINELKNANAEANREISNILADAQQGKSNPAISGLLQQLDILGSNLNKPLSVKDVKDTSLANIEKYTKDLGREDLSQKIKDLLFKNTPELQGLDTQYRDELAKLKTLGLATDDSAAGIVKDQRVVAGLGEKIKSAAKEPTKAAANELENIKSKVSPEVATLIDEALNKGESYALTRKIGDAGLTSPSGYGLRGAAIAGEVANKASRITNVVSDSSLAKAISKLGNGSLGTRVKQVISMPEGEAKERALFILSQQGWFRSATNDENTDKDK